MKLDTLIFGGMLQKHVNMIAQRASRIRTFSIHTIFLICCLLLTTLLSIERLSSVFGRENYVIFTVPSGVSLSSFRPHWDPLFDFLLNFCSCQTARCFNKSKGF